MKTRTTTAAFAAVVLLMLAPTASQAADTVAVGGSTNPSAAVAKAAALFHQRHPSVDVTVKGSSSGAGIADLRNGSIDVAMSDVKVNDPAFSDHAMGTLAIAVIADPSAGVRNITRADLIGIYGGKITNWKQLSGRDLTIVPISRPLGTGTRYVFEQYIAKTLIDTQAPKNAPDVADIVAKTPGAIACVGTSFIDMQRDNVLSYEGVEPTAENIRAQRYTFATQEHLYTRANPSHETQSFVDYVTGNRELLDSFGIF